ncbi:MAG: holo-ACP synthase [Solirubrobacteraceae bacterium]
MIGIDILEIDRLELALARRPRLAERLFTEDELAYARSHASPVKHLAARFCAKEAVAKALLLDLLRPQEIEVQSSGGAPRIVLHGRTRDAARGAVVELSLTHSRGIAAAVAVVR